jgi:hypothetical protein
MGLTDNQPQFCGKGVPVTRAQAAEVWGKQCRIHGYDCWRRESPYEMAQATMILQSLKRRELVLDDQDPPPYLVEETRQLLQIDGVECYVGD